MSPIRDTLVSGALGIAFGTVSPNTDIQRYIQQEFLHGHPVTDATMSRLQTMFRMDAWQGLLAMSGIGPRDAAPAWFGPIDELSHKSMVLGLICNDPLIEGSPIHDDLFHQHLLLDRQATQRQIWAIQDSNNQPSCHRSL